MKNVYIIAGQSNAMAMAAALRASILASDPNATFVSASSAGSPLTWGRRDTDWFQAKDMPKRLVDEVVKVMRANPDANLQSMIWIQGEADTYHFARPSTYAMQFKQFLSNIDSALRLALPSAKATSLDFDVVISQLSRNAPAAPDRENWVAIIDQQKQLDTTSNRISNIDPDDVARIAGISPTAMFKDTLHYSTNFVDKLAMAIASKATFTSLQVTNGQQNIQGTTSSDRITGLGNDSINAGAGDDTVFAGIGDDTVRGGRGNDWVDAGAGINRVWGNSGNDTLLGGSQADSVSGGIGSDSISGKAGDDVLFGDDGSDILDGGAGRDMMNGGGGNDTLRAGPGRDTLTGGSGADVFVFNDARSIGTGNLADQITDFQVRTDRLDLSDLDVAFSNSGFLGLGRPSCYFDSAQSVLIGDQNGDRIADWSLQLAGVTNLTISDLLL